MIESYIKIAICLLPMIINDFRTIEKENLVKEGIDVSNYSFVKIIEFNQSSVYKSDSDFIIFPLSGKYAIQCTSEHSIDSCIKHQHFPVLLETDDPFEKLGLDLNNLDSKVKSAIQDISAMCGDSINLYGNSKSLDSISELVNLKLKALKNDTEKEELLIDLNLYLLDYYRVKTSGEWILNPVYTLNVYFTPMIGFRSLQNSSAMKYSFVKDLEEAIFVSNSVELKQIYKYSMIYYLDINPFSVEFKNFLESDE